MPVGVLASRARPAGACLKTHWVQAKWSNLVLKANFSIEFKELFPIVIACVVWGNDMRNNRILFHCDNSTVVAIINKKTSPEPDIMILVRHFMLS